ncbi:MAG: DUF1018 domain-containing protein [Desulfarculales bacterium]|jgi:hypothetical protein|nr:DUF1018 domain-containing protein [Desulfarculales bacterium]
MQNITAARHAMYAKTEIARKQLPGMGDDNFFQDWMASKFFGKRSRRNLTFDELKRMVDLLGRMGAHYTTNKPGGQQKRPYVRPDFIEVSDDDPNAPTKRMICAIWHKLGYSMTGLETRIGRQTGLSSILTLHDRKELSAILTDLRKREKAFERRKAVEGD